MASIWPPRQWTDTNNVEFWQLNEVSFNYDLLKRPPLTVMAMSQSMAIPGSVGFMPLTWDVPYVDNDEMSDGGTRLVFNTAGYYYIRLNVAWTPGPVGWNTTTHYGFNGEVVIAKNRGGSYSWPSPGTLGADHKCVNSPPANTSIGIRHKITARARFQVGDYIEAFAARAGGTEALAVGGSSSTKDGSFSARFLSL